MHNSYSNLTNASLPTPFYYYDMDLLNQSAETLRHQANIHNIKVRYALKANNNLPILELMASKGFGADCVSGQEIRRALESSIQASDIVFAGVGKTDEEIRLAQNRNIGCLNCESVHELIVIDEIAGSLGKIAPIALRINPDLHAETHKKITTGTRFDKFGISTEEINDVLFILKGLKNVHFMGLHFHIGSQITNMQVFARLALRVNSIQDSFIKKGFFPELINLGGGLGIDYKNPETNPIADFESWLNAFADNLDRKPGQQILIEPGRSLLASCGTLISKVLYLKNGVDADFVIIDAGMNDLIRPALYDANHKIQNLTGKGKTRKYHVAGPVCESSDIFGKNIELPEISRGDYLAIRSTGAYGEVMASGYNLRDLPQAVYSDQHIQDSKNISHTDALRVA